MKFVVLLCFIALALSQDTNANTPECVTGACCENGQFKPASAVCRVTANPCEKTTYCTGYTADCPDTPIKLDGASCLSDGFCTSGHCIRYSCVGECCSNARVAADGTPCGDNKGTCSAGTCIVVEKKKELELTDKEKKIQKKSEKKIRSELEKSLNSLLAKQEKLVVRRERRRLMDQQAKESFLEKMSDIPILDRATIATQSTSKNLANLASSVEEKDKEGGNLLSSGFITLIALGCVVIALIALFGILGASKSNNKKKARKERKVKAYNSDSELYEPPAF